MNLTKIVPRDKIYERRINTRSWNPKFIKPDDDLFNKTQSRMISRNILNHTKNNNVKSDDKVSARMKRKSLSSYKNIRNLNI